MLMYFFMIMRFLFITLVCMLNLCDFTACIFIKGGTECSQVEATAENIDKISSKIRTCRIGRVGLMLSSEFQEFKTKLQKLGELYFTMFEDSAKKQLSTISVTAGCLCSMTRLLSFERIQLLGTYISDINKTQKSGFEFGPKFEENIFEVYFRDLLTNMTSSLLYFYNTYLTQKQSSIVMPIFELITKKLNFEITQIIIYIDYLKHLDQGLSLITMMPKNLIGRLRFIPFLYQFIAND